MALKLTKTALRQEQAKLKQLETYLPTLKLKKFLLQMEVDTTRNEIEELLVNFDAAKKRVEDFAHLLARWPRFDISEEYSKIVQVLKSYENVAGVEIPLFEKIIFPPIDYHLFDTPIWTDSSIEQIRMLVATKEKLEVVQEKKRALEKELKDVSIRVNLFEKILIPRCLDNIKKIRIFLGDQQLAAVAQAKVAKKKIFERKMALAS